MKPGDKVYSPQLNEEFTVKEIKGNAVITEEGAVLNSKLISNVNSKATELFKGMYSKERETHISKVVDHTENDNGEMLYDMVKNYGMPLKTFKEIISRL